MKALVFIGFLIMIASFVVLAMSFYCSQKKNDDKDNKILYVAVILLPILCFIYFSLMIPHGIFRTSTTVELQNEDYKVFVDIEISGAETKSGVQYIPLTIYWPDGGYTMLDSESGIYASEEKEVIEAYDCNFENDYLITIPYFEFSFEDKMKNIGFVNTAYIIIVMAVGLYFVIKIKKAEKIEKDRK